MVKYEFPKLLMSVQIRLFSFVNFFVQNRLTTIIINILNNLFLDELIKKTLLGV